MLGELPSRNDALATVYFFCHNTTMRSFINRFATWRGIEPWLPALFVMTTAPVLVFLSLAVPPGEVPDEAAHIARADSVRHGQVAGFRRPRLTDEGDPATDVAVRVDPSLFAASFALAPGPPPAAKRVIQARLDQLRALSWANQLEAVSIPNTAVYSPLLYLPAATGLQVAKWFKQGPYNSILAARLFNAFAYVVLGAFALCLAQRGHAALFAVLCLPMSLSLAASVNHDGLIIGCAALAGALLTRTAQWSWWGGAGSFALAAMAKPYLLPLALLLPATFPGGWRRKPGQAAAGLAVAALPAIIWGVLMAVFVAAPFVRGPAQPGGPLWSGPPGTLFGTTSPGEQLRILLAAPTRLLTMPAESVWTNWRWLWHEAIGVIGALDVVLPKELYTLWAWGLVASVLAGFFVSSVRTGATSVLPVAAALLGAVASICCAYLLIYLSWTRVGEALIEGVQGRYFLPIAVLALPMATLPLRVPAGAQLRAALSLPVVLLAGAGSCTLPWIIVAAYYIR